MQLMNSPKVNFFCHPLLLRIHLIQPPTQQPLDSCVHFDEPTDLGVLRVTLAIPIFVNDTSKNSILKWRSIIAGHWPLQIFGTYVGPAWYGTI